MNKLIGFLLAVLLITPFPLGMPWAVVLEDLEEALAGPTSAVFEEAALTEAISEDSTTAALTPADLEDSVGGALTISRVATWIDHGVKPIARSQPEAFPEIGSVVLAALIMVELVINAGVLAVSWTGFSDYPQTRGLTTLPLHAVTYLKRAAWLPNGKEALCAEQRRSLARRSIIFHGVRLSGKAGW